uniref:Transmembrane protein n=1 Tax=Steinernema glaseri TaxID=37863 RepID=A0A1I7ZF61_9BILA
MAESAAAVHPKKASVLQCRTSRFEVTLGVFFTAALFHFVADLLAKSPSGSAQAIGGVVVAFAGFFSFVWMRIHSSALSRRRRAYFDEANILETYQPRARAMGHLFQPDPPTPGATVTIADSKDQEMHTDAEKAAFNKNRDTDQEMHTDAEKAAFNKNRDTHYANMFEQAMRLNREMDAAAKAPISSAASTKPEESKGFPKPENPVKSPGKLSEENKTDLSSDAFNAPPDDHTLKDVSEIKSLNLVPALTPEEMQSFGIRRSKSKTGKLTKKKMNLRAIVSLLAFCFCVHGSRTTTMEQLLETNQFLVVGVSGCKITFETDWPDRTCAMHGQEEERVPDSTCTWKAIVPLSDPREQSSVPTKVLFVGQIDSRPVVVVRTLEFPRGYREGHHYHHASILDNKSDLNLAWYSPQTLTGVLYDNEQHLLYLIHYWGSTSSVYIYALDGVTEGTTLKATHAATISGRPGYLGKLKWFSDPYKKKFYYYNNTSAKDRRTGELKSVLMADFIRFVMSDEEVGDAERSIAADPSSIYISGGALFAAYQEQGNQTTRHIVIPLDNFSLAIRCHPVKDKSPDAMMIVRDWEFCKLRDGAAHANYTACRKANTWSKPQCTLQSIEIIESNLISLPGAFLISTTIVLVALVCIVVYCRRSKYSTASHARNVQPAYPNLATDMSYDF